MVRFIMLIWALLLPLSVYAKEMPVGCGTVKDCSSCHRLSKEEAQKLLEFSKAKVVSVKPAPSQGLFEVLLTLEGAHGIVYIDYGKRHLIQGQMIDLSKKTEVIAHEKELPKPKVFSGLPLQELPVEHAFVMGNPKGSVRLAVFTDPDCPHCRSLHPILKELTKKQKDLKVEIYLYPLVSLHPKAYDTARSLMASRQLRQLDDAFAGRVVPSPRGNAGKVSVDAIMAFAEQQGIYSTPTILLPNGALYRGPRSLEGLLEGIGQAKGKQP